MLKIIVDFLMIFSLFTFFLLYISLFEIFDLTSLLFTLAMGIIFSYLIMNNVKNIIYFFIYSLTEEYNLISSKPRKSIVLYCIKLDSKDNLYKVFENFEKSFLANKKHIFVYGSSSKNDEVINLEKKMIKNLQFKYGKNKIMYILRNKKSDFGKKWGFYQDFMFFLYGYDKPITYKNLRGEEKFFEEIIGNVEELRNNKELVFIADYDTFIPEGTIDELSSYAAGDNDYVIYQPEIKIKWNTMYQKIISWCNEFLIVERRSKWRIYKRSPFFGKGLIKTKPYIEIMCKEDNEKIPHYVLSHDLYESFYLPVAYIPKIYIVEEAPSNFLEDLERSKRWRVGDVQALFDLFNKKVENENTFTRVFSVVFSDILFFIWLFGTLFGSQLEFLFLKNYLLSDLIYAIVLFSIIGLPYLIYPFFTVSKKKIVKYLLRGLELIFFTNLLFLQNIVYSTLNSIRAILFFIFRIKEGWEHKEIKVNILTAHLKLYPTLLIGLFLLYSILFGFIELSNGIKMIPFLFSFIFGPLGVALTSK